LHVPEIHTDHPEVRVIQPTWHCLLRFRQRGRHPIGADEAVDGLRDVLQHAAIDAWPPPWAAGQEAERWAVADPFAFPLTRTATPGVWAALTCLTKGTT
jgi:hypothetical protein